MSDHAKTKKYKLFILTTLLFIIEHALWVSATVRIGFRVLNSPVYWIDLVIFFGLILATMFTVGVLTFITVRGIRD